VVLIGTIGGTDGGRAAAQRVAPCLPDPFSAESAMLLIEGSAAPTSPADGTQTHGDLTKTPARACFSAGGERGRRLRDSTATPGWLPETASLQIPGNLIWRAVLLDMILFLTREFECSAIWVATLSSVRTTYMLLNLLL
jgi:hypothetical protein